MTMATIGVLGAFKKLVIQKFLSESSLRIFPTFILSKTLGKTNAVG